MPTAYIVMTVKNSAGVLETARLPYNEDDDHGITNALVRWLRDAKITLDHGDTIEVEDYT
jgi:hypothetical protein